MSENTPKVKPYDGVSDFSMWQVKMKALLIKEKCWKAIEGVWPPNTKAETKTEASEMAHAEIMMRLTDDVARQVLNYTDAKSLWKALETQYLKTSLPSKISLLCRLFSFKMDVNVPLNDNLDRFLRMTLELERCNDKIKDDHQAVLLLSSLPSQFDTLKDVIQYGNDKLTKAKIMEAIIEKNEVLKVFKIKGEKKTESKTEVLMTKGKTKNNKKNANKKNEKNDKNEKEKKDNRKCYHCGKTGHFIKDCKKKQQEEKENNSNDFVALFESAPNYPFELLVCSSSGDKHAWILDSGCTLHATFDKSLFDSLHEYDGGEVLLGDHTALPIRGVGNVPLRMYDGKIRVLQKVRWVPNLRRNLMSESVFDDLGCHIITHSGIREVIKNGATLIKSVKEGGLYKVIASPELNFSKMCNVMTPDLTKLWHVKLGHIGMKGLNYLFKTGLIDKKNLWI